MIVERAKLLNKLLEREFSTYHMIGRVNFAALDVETLKASVSNAIKDEYTAKELKDADMIVLFANYGDLTPAEDSDEEKELGEDEVDTSDTAKIKIKVADVLKAILPIRKDEAVEMKDIVVENKKMFFVKISFK